VRVNIEIPEQLSAKERELLEEFGKIREQSNQKKTFFGKWRVS
jgi:DnaJ-class molecular chaperone